MLRPSSRRQAAAATDIEMARKKHKKKRPAPVDPAKVARPDWAQFRIGYHGRGAHRDKTLYSRKSKHKDIGNGSE